MAGNDGSEEAGIIADKKPSPSGRWRVISRLFEGLHWLTERVISLLRLFVTAAMFLVVAFVIYNAWESRNTVAVKPFQVPVAMGRDNHEQAGSIVANLLNRHLLETQDKLQAQLNPDRNGGINLNRPVNAEQQILIEGESIKLPETGITIDNVIEFISGIFGRKNLNGSVYYESDLNDGSKTKLHLQITLRGRIISFSEDDLGEQQRSLLPATRPEGLNIQLISAMLKARSKEILSIASEDYNLYYYCTRETALIEHIAGEYDNFFAYCRQLQTASVTPKSLQELKEKLDTETGDHDKTIAGTVLTYLKEESRKRQATLCQSKANKADPACQGVKVADARPLPSRTKPTVAETSGPRYSTGSDTNTLNPNSGIDNLVSLQPEAEAIMLNSMLAVKSQCDWLRSEPDTSTGVVPTLEQQCFTRRPMAQQAQQSIAMISSPTGILQSNQAEGDATQLLRNGLYAEALVKYEEAVGLNCTNAVAWANMGILLGTATDESGVKDLKQSQCALFRATTINENAGWMRHSLCVTQALQMDDNLERFLGYESCQLARQLEPINEALYDKLFYIDIADRYRELEKYEQARDAYVQSMRNEKVRSCSMKKALESLITLKDKNVPEAGEQACAIYKTTRPQQAEQDEIPECETDVNKLIADLGCV